MEIETRIQEINGSFYVRVPANMVDYFRIREAKTAKIKDITGNKAELTFPLW